jgi:hypothetical protein
MANEQKKLVRAEDDKRLRSVGTTGFNWTYAIATIDSATINQFVVLANRRDIRQGKVRQLVRLLKDGKHFESAFVVNIVDEQHRLIDGNHRIEAIRKFIADHPGRKVRVAMHVYRDLSPKEELEMYTTWNLGTKQTTNDFIKLHWDEVPQFKRLQVEKGFPVSIAPTWSGKAVEAKLLLNAFFAKDALPYSGPSMVNGQTFIAKAKLISEEDIATLHAAVTDIVAVFGQPDSKSPYYRPAVLQPVLDIWFRNYTKHTSEQLRKKLGRLIGNFRVLDYANQSGTMQTCIFARKDYLTLMNGSAVRNPLM